jgi:hypothetical protein
VNTRFMLKRRLTIETELFKTQKTSLNGRRKTKSDLMYAIEVESDEYTFEFMKRRSAIIEPHYQPLESTLSEGKYYSLLYEDESSVLPQLSWQVF